MSRARFITTLKEGLAGLPQPEIDEIVSDYEFHFSEAAASGHSEDETVAQLGDPGRLVRELMQATAQRQSNAAVDATEPSRNGRWIIPAALVLLAAAGAAYYAAPHVWIDAKPVPADDGAIAKAAGAPPMAKVVISGGQVLNLGIIAQDRLSVVLNGDARAGAQGHAKDLTVQIDGSGTADFSALQADTVHVELIGTGEADVAAGQTADITITGSGIVRLKTKPKQLNKTITGSGQIILPD